MDCFPAPLRDKGARPSFGNEKAGRERPPPSRSLGRARTRFPQGAVQPAAASMKEIRGVKDASTYQTGTVS